MPFFLLISGVALVAALALALRLGLSPFARVALSAMTCLWGILALLLLGSHHFTGAGINTAVIYHLEFGLGGAGFAEYQHVIILLAGALALCLGFAFVLQRRLGAVSRRPGTGQRPLCAALLLTSLALHPACADLSSIYASRWGWTDGLSAGPGVRYIDPVLLSTGSETLNLAFIYLESLERTYLDESEFPGLTPNLNRLRGEGFDFTDIQQLPGTEFTIAGMVASQCGLPLLSTSNGNSNSSDSEFLPGARCMGDLLSEQGFQLSFLGGASLRFGGKGNFFQSHGFDRVQGLEELTHQGEPQALSSWGIHDDDLFRSLTDELEHLYGQGLPHAVFALTLDTHHPRGHPTPSCADMPYGDGGDPMLNSVHCSDHLVGELVRTLRSKPMGERLLIVLASDHLAMRNTVWERLQPMARRNLFVMLPPELHTAVKVDRPGSLLDVGATVLAAMGLRNLGLGHGRDLKGPAPTLVENSRDPKVFVEALAHQMSGYWSYPNLDDGLSIDPAKGTLLAGKRELAMPTLLQIDDSLQIREVVFDVMQPQRLTGYLSLLPDEARYLLIERCPGAVDLGIAIGDVEENCRQSCLFAGRVGYRDSVSMPLCEAVSLSPGAIRHITHGGRRSAPDALYTWRARLTSVYEHAASDSHVLVSDVAGPWQGWQVRSSGFWAGESLLQPPGSSPDGFDVLSQRALSVFEMDPEGKARLLMNLDSCGAGLSGAGDAESITPLAELLHARGETEVLLVVAHDSAVCGSAAPLEQIFAGTSASRWRELRFRQPYVALLSKNALAQEWLGSTERSLLVRFDAAEGTTSELASK